jgi:phosphoglycerate dehydrogenase-like enzyme
MIEVNGIQALGGFTDEQKRTVEWGTGLPVTPICDSAEISNGKLVIVRGGIPVPLEITTLNRIPLVLSGGSGTGNIGASNIANGKGETLVGNCGGVNGNGPEVAVHTIGLLHMAIQDKAQQMYEFGGQELESLYLDTISQPGKVVVVGAGGVGVHTALLLRELGIDPIICRSPGKVARPEFGITNNLRAVLPKSMVVVIAADRPGVIDEEILGLMGNDNIIINMARGNAITEKAYEQICLRRISLYADVWPVEPKKDGELIPLETRKLLESDGEGRLANGTMHEAARQRTAEVAIAHTLVEKINYFLRTGQILPNIDPTTLLPTVGTIRRDADWNQFIHCVEGSPDLTRVKKLRDHLLGIVDRNLQWKALHLDPVPIESSLVNYLRKH